MEIEDNESYWGSKIYRHKYENEFYYHLEVPVSSCAYCDLYEFYGDKVSWSTNEIEEYLSNRKEEKIIWRY